MFLEILCSSSRVNFVLRRCFNFRFIHERMFWEELDDRPEVIQSFFLRLRRQSELTAFSVLSFVFRSKECFSSMISFSMERERECHKSKLRFFEFVF